MENKLNSFVLYKTFYKPISRLTDEQLGRLFRALFEYQINGKTDVEDDIEMAFEFFLNQFRIDAERHEKIIQARSNAGKKGMELRWNKNNNNNEDNKSYQDITSVTEDNTNNLKVNINVNDNINVDDKKKSIKKSASAYSLDFIPAEEPFSKYRQILDVWLRYKKDRGERYKNQNSVEMLYKKLFNLSGGNTDVAEEIIAQSMANNWAGLFPLKDTGTDRKTSMDIYRSFAIKIMNS